MTQTVLAIGECMVEMAPTGDGHYAMGFAGDTFNTAWYLRKLAGDDLNVSYFSAVGDDAASAQMTAFMQDAGVTPELRVIPGASVGLYMISLKDGERSFSYWRSASAARQMADGLSELPNLKAGDVAFFSGITLAILPVEGRETLLSVLAKARAGGVRIVFDPNLRPRLWASDQEMCDWIMRGAAVADIALPSFEDEATYFNDADKAATAKRYADAGVTLSIVKDGADTVLIDAAGEPPETATPLNVIQVVDTTAAGDSFNAGFLSGLMSGQSNANAVRAGCELAAQVVGKRGALVDLD
ncbi:MAG: sugar kinase [Pseudomonadota bacterium]|nr:sugar kinase [Pseudomonadota bacterium]